MVPFSSLLLRGSKRIWMSGHFLPATPTRRLCGRFLFGTTAAVADPMQSEPVLLSCAYPLPPMHISHIILFYPPLPSGMYVMARSKGDRVYCKVYVPGEAHVDDLKQAAMAKLKLDISLTRVRLVHELDGGTTRDLDNYALLAEAGLAAGSRVLVEHVGELLWLAECSATHTSSYYCLLLHTLTHAPLLSPAFCAAHAPGLPYPHTGELPAWCYSQGPDQDCHCKVRAGHLHR